MPAIICCVIELLLCLCMCVFVCTAPYRHLVELGCIKPLCDLLTLMDSKIVQVALNGLENILRLGELEAKRGGGGINPYCALIEEAYGKDHTQVQTSVRRVGLF